MIYPFHKNLDEIEIQGNYIIRWLIFNKCNIPKNSYFNIEMRKIFLKNV
jgi:hypothetical protein